jgi:predicted transcriptional regulator of viral defense system
LIHGARPVKLDPSRPAGGTVDSSWRVDVNLAAAELAFERVG